jgi:hypothetical protein
VLAALTTSVGDVVMADPSLENILVLVGNDESVVESVAKSVILELSRVDIALPSVDEAVFDTITSKADELGLVAPKVSEDEILSVTDEGKLIKFGSEDEVVGLILAGLSKLETIVSNRFGSELEPRLESVGLLLSVPIMSDGLVTADESGSKVVEVGYVTSMEAKLEIPVDVGYESPVEVGNESPVEVEYESPVET